MFTCINCKSYQKAAICYDFDAEIYLILFLSLDTSNILNFSVAYKLSKRKPDDNLQMLHNILYGKKSKVIIIFLLANSWTLELEMLSLGFAASAVHVLLLNLCACVRGGGWCVYDLVSIIVLYGFDGIFDVSPFQVHSLKKNIGQFSGFVWVENEVSCFYLLCIVFHLSLHFLFYTCVNGCNLVPE